MTSTSYENKLQFKKILKIKFKEYKNNIKKFKKRRKEIYLKINKFIEFQH